MLRGRRAPRLAYRSIVKLAQALDETAHRRLVARSVLVQCLTVMERRINAEGRTWRVPRPLLFSDGLSDIEKCGRARVRVARCQSAANRDRNLLNDTSSRGALPNRGRGVLAVERGLPVRTRTAAPLRPSRRSSKPPARKGALRRGAPRLPLKLDAAWRPE